MTSFAVAAGHDLSADTAADVLRAGGTAVDAALAAAMTAMVAEPVLAGLLGGGFLMVRPPGRLPELLDFFVQTPRRAKPAADLDFRAIEAEFGTARQTFHVGAGSIATPGVAPGLAEAHARFGRMPIRELASPAIAHARDGVAITLYQRELSRIVEAILTATPQAEQLFFPDGTTPGPGTRWRNPDFADVLEEYAHEGPRFVTEGEVAQRLLSLSASGGHLTREDLAAYRPAWRTALTVKRAEAEIALNPAPSLGGTLIAFALDLAPARPVPEVLAEVLYLTAQARLEADLDQDPVAGAARLLSPERRTQFRGLLDRARSLIGTTHISVIDKDGMGAALTLSNGAGSGVIVPGTGIMANNMLGESDLLGGNLQGWCPDRRLSSMMSPLSVAWPDGRFAMLGSGGSNRIRTALAQVLMQVIDHGAALQDAIPAPRLHSEGGTPRDLDFEDLFGEDVCARLMTHWPEARAWADRSMFFGGVHGVMGTRRGGSDAMGDPRRAGAARTG